MSDDIRALVPIRSLAEGKSRLAGCLTDAARESLNREMLHHCLHVLGACDGLAGISVVTRDAAAAECAAEHGADIVAESAPAGLNAALSEAVAACSSADAVLILPADLPRLAADDVDALLAATGDIVIAPDDTRSGTNALLLRPPQAIRPAFGPDSFTLHLEAARAAGIAPVIVDRPGLAFDLDTPEDYTRWRAETSL